MFKISKKRDAYKVGVENVRYGDKRQIANFIIQEVYDGEIAYMEFRTVSHDFSFRVDVSKALYQLAYDFVHGKEMVNVEEYLGSVAYIVYMNATRYITPKYIEEELTLIKKDVARVKKSIFKNEKQTAKERAKADNEALEEVKDMMGLKGEEK